MLDLILILVGVFCLFVGPKFIPQRFHRALGIVAIVTLIGGIAIGFGALPETPTVTEKVVSMSKLPQTNVVTQSPVCVKIIEKSYKWAGMRDSTQYIILDTKECNK